MKDISFLADTEQVVEAPMRITGVVTGRAVLGQRVMTMMLRSITDPARTYETGILQDVGASNVRGPADLANDFSYAATQVRSVIANEQSTRTDLTDDETLSDINVENIQADGDTVSADIRVITVSGEAIVLALEV